jgi:hypothetical protein
VIFTIFSTILMTAIFSMASGLLAPPAEAGSIHGIVEEGGLPSPLVTFPLTTSPLTTPLGTGLTTTLPSPITLTSPTNWISEIRIRPLEMGGLSNHVFPLQTSIAIRSALSTLQPGDYVVLTGRYVDQDFDGKNDLLAVSGIESVGLKRILGDWRNESWDVFRFHDYNRLGLYRRDAGTRPAPTLKLRKLKELNYTLAPEAQGSFSVLMVEAINPSIVANSKVKPVFAGRIQITSPENLLLEVFDPKSGSPVERHNLKPVQSGK